MLLACPQIHGKCPYLDFHLHWSFFVMKKYRHFNNQMKTSVPTWLRILDIILYLNQRKAFPDVFGFVRQQHIGDDDVVIVSKCRIAKKQRKNLPIIFENNEFIVINKPAGLLSVASDNEKGRTAYRMVTDYVQQIDKHNRIYISLLIELSI